MRSRVSGVAPAWHVPFPAQLNWPGIARNTSLSSRRERLLKCRTSGGQRDRKTYKEKRSKRMILFICLLFSSCVERLLDIRFVYGVYSVLQWGISFNIRKAENLRKRFTTELASCSAACPSMPRGLSRREENPKARPRYSRVALICFSLANVSFVDCLCWTGT